MVYELVDSWQTYEKELEAYQKKINKPLMLAEIGYYSQAETARAPWNWTAAEKADVEAQEKCYEALYEAWHDNDVLKGIYIYLWDENKSGAEDNSYSIKDKPAERIIIRWFLEK